MMGLEIDIRAIVELLHDLDRCLACREPGGFVTVTEDDIVDTGIVAVDGLAVADRETDQVLQLDRHMFDHVARPGAGPDPVEEPAGRAHGTAVIMDARDQALKPVGDPGHLVAGPLFQFADIQPHVDRLIATEIVGTAQRAVFKYMQYDAPGFWP